MSNSKSFCVHLRQVDDKDIKKDVAADQLYVLPNKPPFNRCFRFEPKNVTDFDKTREYGMHDGDDMVKYFIILMAGSFDELQTLKASSHKRFAMPKRRSIGDAHVPFGDYTVIERSKKIKMSNDEKKSAELDKASKLKGAKSNVRKEQDAAILKQNDLKRSSLTSHDETGGTPPKQLKTAEDVYNNNEFSPKWDSTEDKNFTPCDECAPGVLNLKKQLDLALRAAEESTAVYEEAKKERDMYKEQLDKQASNISEINKKLSTLPDQIRSNQNDCWVANLSTNIVPVEKTFKNISVPQGFYYIGDGLTVSGVQLAACADADTMRQRVELLCDKFFGDDLPFMSPSGTREKYGKLLPKLKKIQECNYTAMRAVLTAMPWDCVSAKEKNFNTMAKTREGVRKYTLAACADYCKENFPVQFKEIEESRKKKKVTVSENLEAKDKNEEAVDGTAKEILLESDKLVGDTAVNPEYDLDNQDNASENNDSDDCFETDTASENP